MNRGLKIYGAILIGGVALWLLSLWYQPGEVRALNAILAEDPTVSSYPYRFKVLEVTNDTAVVSSPRSAEVPVPVMIIAIDPNLTDVAITDPRYLEAQQKLAITQARVRDLLTEAPNINSVRWQLDRPWLNQNGIQTWD